MGRRNFTREFKLEAVREASRGDRSLSGLARDLGINRNLLARWKRQLAEEGEPAFPGKGHLKPEEERTRQLERENLRLREELSFLKKTATYFAKQSERGTR